MSKNALKYIHNKFNSGAQFQSKGLNDWKFKNVTCSTVPEGGKALLTHIAGNKSAEELLKLRYKHQTGICSPLVC